MSAVLPDLMHATQVARPSLKWLKVKQRNYRVKERGFYRP